MPIDVTLLRPLQEGGNAELVLSWQLARSASTKSRDQQREVVAKLQNADSARRSALRSLNAARKQLNEAKRKLRPSNDDSAIDRNLIKEEASELSKRIIPELSEKVASFESEIREELPKLANSIDTTPFAIERNCVRDNGKDYSKKDVIIDPLFCLGAYEAVNLPFSCGGNNTEEKSRRRTPSKILTGNGVSIATALSQYIPWCFSSGKNEKRNTGADALSQLQLLNSPGSIGIDESTAHNIFGCSKSLSTGPNTCEDCDANSCEVFQAPPFLMAALQHTGKQYPDSTLPKNHLVLSRYTEPEPEDDGSSTPRPHRFSHEIDQLSLVTLALPSIAASRESQDKIATSLFNMFNDLLVLESTQRIALSNRRPYCPTLRAQSVDDASKLVMNECRRVIIEGYLPSIDAYVDLGYVSNTTDYISRALGIRCGSSAVGKGKHKGASTEHPHIIHGLTCNTGTLLTWIVENNTARLKLFGEDHQIVEGVALPKTLSDFMRINDGDAILIEESDPQTHFMFLPFRRRVVVGKKGKRVALENDERKTLSRCCNVTNAEKNRKSKAGCIPHGFATTRSPTQADLEAEKLSNPFSFLPIGATSLTRF